MGGQIEALLNLSRLTRREISRTEVDLSEMAQSILTDLHRSAPDRKVEIRVAPGLRVVADAFLMQTVMENLILNAWKYTGRKEVGEIEFGATYSPGIPPGSDSGNQSGQTAFFVRDNGVGFDMKYKDKLFGVFQRLHSSTEFQGAGVGLASVYRIIKRHGGAVWFEAGVDQGATFYFSV